MSKVKGQLLDDAYDRIDKMWEIKAYEYSEMNRLKKLITKLLEDHHPAELPELTGADWYTCFKLVHEIRKDGGFDPNDWEPEKSGDIWAIYGKTFSAEWIDEHGECLAFDTKREANEYIRENIK